MALSASVTFKLLSSLIKIIGRINSEAIATKNSVVVALKVSVMLLS